MARLVILSDLHLSPTHGFFWQNFLLARQAANAIDADAVVVSGDLAINGPDSDEELAFATGALKGIKARCLALPGNHDVGDEPPGQDAHQLIDLPRLARWDRYIGPDRWALDLHHWTVLGLNSQLPGSGLAREAEQNQWLDHELARAAGRRIAIIMHKPLFIETADESTPSPSSTVPSVRPGLMQRFAKGGVELVVSGHLHTHRDRVVDGVRYLWVPATSFNGARGLTGDNRNGFISLELNQEGAHPTVHRPAGLVDHDLLAIKGHGRYSFLRDMPPCPPEVGIDTL
jgi:3',5'-cyclic AMP phosphodiesterase CpdA